MQPHYILFKGIELSQQKMNEVHLFRGASSLCVFTCENVETQQPKLRKKIYKADLMSFLPLSTNRLFHENDGLG